MKRFIKRLSILVRRGHWCTPQQLDILEFLSTKPDGATYEEICAYVQNKNHQ